MRKLQAYTIVEKNKSQDPMRGSIFSKYNIEV